MSLTTVDRRYRIVIDKQLRAKIRLQPGDKVFLEPVDKDSFRALVMRHDESDLHEDPAWKAIHSQASPKRHVSQEGLHALIEKEAWES